MITIDDYIDDNIVYYRPSQSNINFNQQPVQPIKDPANTISTPKPEK